MQAIAQLEREHRVLETVMPYLESLDETYEGRTRSRNFLTCSWTSATTAKRSCISFLCLQTRRSPEGRVWSMSAHGARPDAPLPA